MQKPAKIFNAGAAKTMLKITERRKEKIKQGIRNEYARGRKRAADALAAAFKEHGIFTPHWDVRYLALPKSKCRAELEMEKAIYLLGSYMDGILTETELISQLSELPKDITDLLPDELQSSRPYRSIKSKINKLRDARARGETIRIKSHC
jgi:hypothetical protein